MDSDLWQYLSFHYRRTLSLESSSSFPSLPDQYNVCSLIDVLLFPIIRYDVEVNVSYVKLFSRPLKSTHLRDIARKQCPADFFNK